MEGPSLHGTLHATIYEVDRLHTGGGSNVFSKVHLYMSMENSFVFRLISDSIALPVCNFDFSSPNSQVCNLTVSLWLTFFLWIKCLCLNVISMKFSDLWLELILEKIGQLESLEILVK